MAHQNEILHKIAVLGALGGSVFDYYLDKGIRKLNIYAETQYLSAAVALYEQAFWFGVEIEGVYSSERQTINGINCFERQQRTKLVVEKYEAYTGAVPFITFGKYPRITAEHHQFTPLASYSLRKRVLFDPVLHYKQEFTPDLKLVCLFTPQASEIINPDEWEQKLKTGKATPEEQKRAYYKTLSLSEEEFPPKDFFGSTFSTYNSDGVFFVKDVHIKELVNVSGGYRVTHGVPYDARKTIYTFGGSNCFCFGATDASTIQSTLQRCLNLCFANNDFGVLNCGNGGIPNYKRQKDSFFWHHPKNDDIVVFIHGNCDEIFDRYKDRVLFVRPQIDDRIFDRPHSFGEIFSNTEWHLTDVGCEAVGTHLFNKMLDKGMFDEDMNSAKTVDASIISTISAQDNIQAPPPSELVHYMQSVKPQVPRIGSIVMNCNPFTLGHRYLIEESARKVTNLIIFVVEEDKSVFPFKDRLELVKKGTADLPNITVVPSGGFIISQQTFGAYFEKDSGSVQKVDPTDDVMIFARHIAPALGITARFAGEEPFDNVTQQYNDTMKHILPHHGIDFEVIPRKESDGEAISASRVRKLLEKQNFEEIAKLVPKTTLEYLVNPLV